MYINRLEDAELQALSHDTDIMKRVLLSESVLPAGVRLSHAVLKPGQQTAEHDHALLTEVFYVLSGQGELVVDGVSQVVGAGSAFSIEPGEQHVLRNHAATALTLLYFALS